MDSNTYDLIVVGGGIGGSAIAKAMAERGAKVLVVESEEHFRDRVRGEWIAPWGIAEAKALGIYDLIIASGGHELRWLESAGRGRPASRRDFVTTSVPGVPSVSFYHPSIQEAMLQAAMDSGAKVVRGAKVLAVKAEDLKVVTQISGHEMEMKARLVVGADGRESSVRSWAGFEILRDPKHNLITGVLLENMSAPDDAAHIWRDPSAGLYSLAFPQGHGRTRAYLCTLSERGELLSGVAALSRFVDQCVEAGAPADYYRNTKIIGPLATFQGADTWIRQPCRKGVVLIGDAAAASDPTWGQGVSLTLRDVRVLRDELLRSETWDKAGQSYAEEHDRYYGVLHTFESWVTQMFMTIGDKADAIRAKAFPLWKEDPTRVPDITASGPNETLDETTRKRFFGEE